MPLLVGTMLPFMALRGEFELLFDESRANIQANDHILLLQGKDGAMPSGFTQIAYATSQSSGGQGGTASRINGRWSHRIATGGEASGTPYPVQRTLILLRPSTPPAIQFGSLSAGANDLKAIKQPMTIFYAVLRNSPQIPGAGLVNGQAPDHTDTQGWSHQGTDGGNTVYINSRWSVWMNLPPGDYNCAFGVNATDGGFRRVNGA